MENLIFVLTGPSGAGKTTNWKIICQKRVDTAGPARVVTTRAKRDGEKEGQQYNFVSKEQFLQMQENSEFAVSTKFIDNYYGLAFSQINEVLVNDNKDMIFDSIMEVPDVKAIGKNVVVIYLTTSSDEELERRIVERSKGTISNEERINRMTDARRQRAKVAPLCDYIVKTDYIRGQDEITAELMDIMDKVKQFYKETGETHPKELQRFTPKSVLRVSGNIHTQKLENERL